MMTQRDLLNVIKDDKDIHGIERDIENVLKALENDLNAENWALIKRYFKVLNASASKVRSPPPASKEASFHFQTLTG